MAMADAGGLAGGDAANRQELELAFALQLQMPLPLSQSTPIHMHPNAQPFNAVNANWSAIEKTAPTAGVGAGALGDTNGVNCMEPSSSWLNVASGGASTSSTVPLISSASSIARELTIDTRSFAAAAEAAGWSEERENQSESPRQSGRSGGFSGTGRPQQFPHWSADRPKQRLHKRVDRQRRQLCSRRAPEEVQKRFALEAGDENKKKHPMCPSNW